MKNIHIPSSIGDISANFFESDAKDKLAVLCPGYLDSKDYCHMMRLSSDLADAGYNVICFNPTGTWDSGGEVTNYSVTQILQDIESVIVFMHRKESYKHLLLGGHSLGGVVSLLYAQRHDNIDVVLGVMPPYSVKRTNSEEQLKAWELTGNKISERDIPGDDSHRKFRVPYSFVQDRLKYNIIDSMQDYRGKTILLAGEADELVKAADVERIYLAANEPKEYIVANGIGHDYRHHQDQIQIINDLLLEKL